MVDSSNDYAKYRPKMAYPKDAKKPNIMNYNMNDPVEIRKYADAMAVYNEVHEKFLEERAEYQNAETHGINDFCHDLLKEDREAGICSRALDEAFCIAREYGEDFDEWKRLYEKIASAIRMADAEARK